MARPRSSPTQRRRNVDRPLIIRVTGLARHRRRRGCRGIAQRHRSRRAARWPRARRGARPLRTFGLRVENESASATAAAAAAVGHLALFLEEEEVIAFARTRARTHLVWADRSDAGGSAPNHARRLFRLLAPLRSSFFPSSPSPSTAISSSSSSGSSTNASLPPSLSSSWRTANDGAIASPEAGVISAPTRIRAASAELLVPIIWNRAVVRSHRPALMASASSRFASTSLSCASSAAIRRISAA